MSRFRCLPLLCLAACSPQPAPVVQPPPPPPPAPVSAPLPAPRLVLEMHVVDPDRLVRLLAPANLPAPELLPADLAWSRAAAPPEAELALWGLTVSGSGELALAHGVRLSSGAAALELGRARGFVWSESDRVSWSPDRRWGCGLAPQGQTEWLICAKRADAVRIASAALAQRAAPAGPGVQVELAPSRIAADLGPGLSAQLGPVVASLLGIESRNVKFDQASGELIRGLVQEGVDSMADVDRAVLRLDPTSDDSELRLEAELHFTGDDSWTAGLLAQPTAHTPELFWSLPAGADDAWFFQGQPARRYEPLRAVATRLLYELLDYQGTPQLLREHATRLLRELPLPSVPIVYASGAIEAAAKKPEGAEFQRSTGWHLLGIAEPPDRVIAFLDACAAAYQDDVLGSQLRRVLRGFGERLVPVGVKRKTGAAGQLPRGTLVWELAMPGRKIDPRKGRFVVDRDAPESMPVFVVGRDDETWVGWAGHATAAREQLAALLRADPRRATLQDRQRAAALRAEGALLGGIHRSELVTLLRADHAARRLTWSATLPSHLLGDLLSPASP